MSRVTSPIVRMTVGGIDSEFRGSDIISATLVQQIKPLSIELPFSELEVTIYTTDTRYSMFSDGSFYNSLSRRQPLDLYESINGIEFLLGRFYLDDWKYISQNKFWIKGVDAIGVLDTVPFDGYFWSTNTTLSSIIDTIMSSQNIDYAITGGIGSTLLRGWIAPGTIRSALQQAAFAAGATVVGIKSEVVIEKTKLPLLDANYTLEINDTQKKDTGELSLLPFVTEIELISHDYSKGAELKTIFDKWLAAGSYKITFQEPYYDIVATGAGYTLEELTTEDGITLTTEGGDPLVVEGDFIFGPNSIYLSVPEPGGDVLIQGYPWVDSQQSHQFYEDVTPDIKKNRLSISSATLVTPEVAEDVLNRLTTYYRQRYSQKFTVLVPALPTRYYGDPPPYGDGLYEADPTIRINEICRVTTYSGKRIRGLIEKLNVDLAMGFIIEIENIGVEAT